MLGLSWRKRQDALAIGAFVQPARHHVTQHAAGQQPLAGHHHDAAQAGALRLGQKTREACVRLFLVSDVPDCRPSPAVGRCAMPCLISASGGCMFTTSAEPG
jgi:hypothetical protein